MELARISEQNPWWTTGTVRDELCPPFERDMVSVLATSLSERRVRLLRGPRRTGKSTVLYQLVRRLLSSGTDPRRILYFSFDGEKARVADLLNHFKNDVLGEPIPGAGKLYFLLDEVQKAPGWSEDVKLNYDLYPNIKFVLSGSTSFQMAGGAAESLAGRASEAVLLPMSFAEFLGVRGIGGPRPGEPLEEFLIAENSIRPYFSNYLLTGGFPELAGEDRFLEVQEYVQSSVVQRAVYGDLFAAGGVGDPESLMALVRTICGTPGMIINHDALGKAIGRDRRTVGSYLARLEQAMIIRTIGCLRGGALASSRKGRKAYPISTALTYAFGGPDPDDRVRGLIAETAALNSIGAGHYWRKGGKEIDFVTGEQDEIAWEVKLDGKGPFPFDILSDERKLRQAFVITADSHGYGSAGRVGFERIPLWALSAGAALPKGEAQSNGPRRGSGIREGTA